MRMNFSKLIVVAGISFSLPAFPQDCGTPQPGSQIRVVKDAVLFTAKELNVDADGAPNAYFLNGNGLSYTCDGVVAIENGKRVTPDSGDKDWQKKCNAAWSLAKQTGDYSKVAIFGFSVDMKTRKPLVQSEGEPFPGTAYISTTTVSIPGTPEGTQRHYVDATKIPYVVLPSSFVRKYKVQPGSLAVVYRPLTDKYAFGIYADGGNLGEASLKLHQDLGNNPYIVRNGIQRGKRTIPDPTITVVFPGQIVAPIADNDKWTMAINAAGLEKLNEFGGVTRLRGCSK